MTKAKENDWLRILEVIRKIICPAKSPVDFSVDDVVARGGVVAGPSSEPRFMASGYLSSFRKWGFIKRVGKLKQSGPGRPTYTYRVTDYGYDFECLESQRGLDERHLKLLIDSVNALREAKGDRSEAVAMRDLTAKYDQVVKERAEYQRKKDALAKKNAGKRGTSDEPADDGLSHGVPED